MVQDCLDAYRQQCGTSLKATVIHFFRVKVRSSFSFLEEISTPPKPPEQKKEKKRGKEEHLSDLTLRKRKENKEKR